MMRCGRTMEHCPATRGEETDVRDTRDRLPPTDSSCDSTHTGDLEPRPQGEGAPRGCWQLGGQSSVQGAERFSLEEESSSRDGWLQQNVTVFTANELFA